MKRRGEVLIRMAMWALISFAGITQGATYYIDASTGSDTNNGLSWASAWRSFLFGTPTITFGPTTNPSGSTYLYVGKD